MQVFTNGIALRSVPSYLLEYWMTGENLGLHRVEECQKVWIRISSFVLSR